MARQLSTWKRVARGTVDMTGITRTIVLRSIKALAHNIAETWGKIRQKDSVRSIGLTHFRSLAARGVQTRFVFVEEDPGLDEMEIVFGRGGHLLQVVPKLAITILDEGDHIFSWNHSRRLLFTIVEQALAEMTAPNVKRTAR